MGAYEYRPASFDEAVRVKELTSGGSPDNLKEYQFWYNLNGDLVMVLTICGDTEFSAIQVVEIRRAIITLYPRRNFSRFTYAPIILNKIA
jgi:hypothetical protein